MLFSCFKPEVPRRSLIAEFVDSTPIQVRTEIHAEVAQNPRASSMYSNLQWCEIENACRVESPQLEGRPRPDSYTLPPLSPVPSLHLNLTPPQKLPSLAEQRSSLRRLNSFLPPPIKLPVTKEYPMALLEVALAYVLQNEGSAFVNDPDDHGGATRYGVTQSTLTAYLGRAATINDVSMLTVQTVTDVYRRLYWAPIRGDEILRQGTATVLLDMAVLCGPTAAIRMAQDVVKATPDGLLGPKTLAAINALPGQVFVQALSLGACQYFQAIAQRDKTQAKWLAGWCYRAHKMNLQMNA